MTDEFKSKVALASQKYKTSEETNAFEEGVVFGLNAIWHDIDEEPDKFPCMLLFIANSTKNKFGVNLTCIDKDVFYVFIKDGCFERWCYLEDLL